ncbi:LolA-like protein [Paenibacillus puerhi]|uniref:hypothetical protein n=1 Tax=Paenibacillus puerhi TaxID=2692622 RepID=UPI0013599A69|nr:hypothetical protein [Paenibacillus puerhi]
MTSVYAANQLSSSDPIAAANSQTIDVQKKEPISISTIQDKMLNAVDNYQSLKGSYHKVTPTVDRVVEFEIQEGSAPGSYVRVQDKSGKSTETRFSGNTISVFDLHTKKVSQNRVGTPIQINKSEPRYYKDENEENHFVYRGDPAVADQASDVALPQAYAFWLYTSVPTITGEDNLFDRNTAIVEGDLEKGLAEKRKATRYKMWVDTETGVLLKLIETNSKNEVVNTLEVTSIEFNKPTHSANFYVPEQVEGFSKNGTGYPENKSEK